MFSSLFHFALLSRFLSCSLALFNVSKLGLQLRERLLQVVTFSEYLLECLLVPG